MSNPSSNPDSAVDPTTKAPGRGGWFFSNAYLMLTLTPLFWAGNIVMGRAIAGHIPPFALGNTRWIVAAALMFPFAWPHLKRDWPVVRQHLPAIIWLGVIGPTLFNSITYVGLNYTTALNGLIIQAGAPALIVMAAYICFGDRFTWLQSVGLAVSVIGVLAIVSRGDISALASLEVNKGDALILLAFCCWALYTVFLRKRPDVHWLTFAFAIALVAAVANLPFWAYEHASGAQLQMTWTTLLAILYAGTFPSIISYNLFNRGVQLIGSNRAGAFLNLVPLFGSAMAIGLLGEKFETFHIAGFALIIAGVTLAARKS